MTTLTRALLSDAFGHHVWATLRIIDSCAGLTDDQLATTVPGTYGSILDTLRHTVSADAAYLHVLTDESTPLADEEQMGLDELRAVMERNGPAWQELVAGELDPTRDIVRHRDDGSESHAPLGIRVAQVIHHGTDHRSQICTALTTLGIEPPLIDVWDFGELDGRVRLVEAPPGA